MRDVYEAAIVQLGLDVARGRPIWQEYRDFEERLLDIMLSLGDAKNAYDAFFFFSKVFYCLLFFYAITPFISCNPLSRINFSLSLSFFTSPNLLTCMQ